MNYDLMKFFDVEFARVVRLYRDTQQVDARELVDLVQRCQQAVYEYTRQHCSHPHDPRLPCPWPDCRAGVPGDRYACVAPEEALLATYVASAPPTRTRAGTLYFVRRRHSESTYAWEVEEPGRSKHRIPASEDELKAARVLIDALIDGAPSENADAVVGETIGLAKALREIAGKLNMHAPPFYAEIDATKHMSAAAKALFEAAERVEKLGEGVRKIRNEPLGKGLHTLAQEIGIDLETPQVVRLEELLLLEVGGRLYRSWVTRVNITHQQQSFEPYVTAAGAQMFLANGRSQRVELDVRFTAVPKKEDE